jgi:hypothetical protein
MEARTEAKPKRPSSDPHWYEEFGLIPRFPRPPLKKIGKLIDGIQEPQILLRQRKRSTDVVITLPVCSRIFRPEEEKAFAKFGVTLPRAFDDVLWQKLDSDGSTTWAKLTGLVIKAYRQSWDHWARLHYLGHFHPQADTWFNAIKEEVDSVSKIAHRGRKPSTLAELASLKKRYNQLLPSCALVHRAAKTAAASHTRHDQKDARKEIRRAIWEQVQPSIHGMSGDGYIFGGQAFKRMHYGTPKLHEPTTWKPKQLAISLLSLELGQAYQTIEKKLAVPKSK